MNKSFSAIPILLLICGLGAGAVAQPDGLSLPPSGLGGPCKPPAAGPEGRSSLLQFYGWLQSASSDEREMQFRRARSAAANGEPREKLVLALILVLPNSPFTDFERAKSLLGEFLGNSDEGDPDERYLATLILELLDEVARLEAKLEQLQAIEKNITETEQSVNVPAPTPAPAPAPSPNDKHEEDDTTSR